MLINTYEFAEGAVKARGLAVVIDVFRAFSTGCYAFDTGAVSIIAVPDVESAFELKKKYKKSVLAGERNEKKINGFDFGNSPTEMLQADLNGTTVIQTTTAGTNGLIKAGNCEEVITGSLVNAAAVVRYIRSLNPQEVSLVAMGYRCRESAEEDLLCAEIIRSRLEDNNIDFSTRISALKDTSGRRFFMNENLEFSPPTDFFLCTSLDRFDFVMKGTRRLDGNVDLMRIDI